MASEQNPFGVDFDLSSEQQNVSRQQMMADMLMKMAFQPAAQGRMVSGHYVAPSLFESLNPVLGALGGQYAQQGADAARKKLQDTYNAKLSGGLDSYFKQRDGTPAGQTAAVPAQNLPTEDGLGFDMPENPGMAYPAVPGNPRKAAITALTSGLPALSRLGQSDLEALAKGQLTPKDLLTIPGASVSSRVSAATGLDPRLLRPEQKLQALGDRLYDVTEGTGEPQLRLDARKKFGAPFDIRGSLFQNELGTGEIEPLDKAPRVTIGNTTIGDGQKAGVKELAELGAKTVAELNAGARAASQSLSTLRQIEASADAGVLQGPTANFGIFLGQIATAAGLRVDANKLANSETVQSEVTRLWASTMAANGGARGLVKEESDRIANSLPSLIQTPEGRRDIIRVMRMKAEQDIAVARQAQQEFARAVSTGNFEDFTYGIGAALYPQPAIDPRPAAPGRPVTRGASPGLTLPEGFRIIEVLPPPQGR